MAEDPAVVEILGMVQRGEITAEEGLRLMNAMQNRDGASSGLVEERVEVAGEEKFEPAMVVIGEILQEPAQSTPPMETPASEEVPGDQSGEDAARDEAARAVGRWKRWWQLPFWIGTGITILGAWWMYLGYHEAAFGWGFWLSWFPFLVGLGIMVASWRSSTARWLHVRVHSSKDRHTTNFAISLPLPLRLGVWAMRNFGRYIPDVRDRDIGGMLDTLDQSISTDEPVYIHVNDKDGEEVEVFIG